TGRTPSASAVALMRRTASSAFSTVEMNGKVTWRKAWPSNCVSRLCPMVSAVTPVWSDTKKTVRLSTVDPTVAAAARFGDNLKGLAVSSASRPGRPDAMRPQRPLRRGNARHEREFTQCFTARGADQDLPKIDGRATTSRNHLDRIHPAFRA